MKVDHAAACRFFTPEDACRLALAAYYGASHDVEPPQGEPWTDEAGLPYADTSGFSSAFLHHLERSVMRLAGVKGVPFGYAHGGALPVDQNPFSGVAA